MTAGAVPIVILHDVGDAGGGGPWRSALEEAGWPGPVLAPDLPGHCGQPPPVDGSYELVDAAWFSLRLLRQASFDSPPVVLGVGTNGWAAQLLALGGRACALALVDGLGGPWQSPSEWVESQRSWIRAVAGDPAAVAVAVAAPAAPAGAPPDGMDPRLSHGVAPMTGRRMAEKAARALSMPVLIVQSPRSALNGAEAEDLAGRFRPPATMAHVGDRSPDLVAPPVVRWLFDNGSQLL